MIYFLQRTNGDVKIGTTRSYVTRLAHLKVEYGELTLLGVVPGNRKKEQQLHEVFSSQRIGRTEWFVLNDDIAAFIEQHATLDIPEDEMNSASATVQIVVSDEIRDRLKDVSKGMGVSYDTLIRFWMSKIVPDGVDPLIYGHQVRSEAQRYADIEASVTNSTKEQSA